MKCITFLAAVIAGIFLFGAKAALAHDCVALGGAIVAGECRIRWAAKTVPFNLDETLHALSTRRVDATGCEITLNICVALATPSPSRRATARRSDR